MVEVRFDDYEGLNAQIGEFGQWSKPITVTQEMINQFAELTGDHQWIHVDVERAIKESPFGGPIAHGFLTLSLIPQLVPSDALRLVGQTGSANYGAEKLRFIAPVPAGSALHARNRLVRVEAKPRGTLLTREVEVAVVGAQQPAVLYAMQILYMGSTQRTGD
jgi:acyl dehydratase